MVKIQWNRRPWIRIVNLVLVVVILTGLVGCSISRDRATPQQLLSEPSEKPNQLVGRIAEVSPPQIIQTLRQSLERYQPQVKILVPQPGQVVKDTSVSVRFQVKDLPLFKDAELGLGPHLNVFLDDRPYQAAYDTRDALVFSDLTPGSHTLRAFAVRPWGESFKNQGAYAEVTFHVFAETPRYRPERYRPLLTYNTPQDSYGAEPIMLDFYLTNAPLHMIAQENDSDDVLDWRVRCTVNGQSFVFDQWQPIYLKGFKPGINWVQLALIDENGDPIENVFNNEVRLIEYAPGGEDTLSKLVRDDVTIAAVGRIIDQSYQPPVEPEIPEASEISGEPIISEPEITEPEVAEPASEISDEPIISEPEVAEPEGLQVPTSPAEIENETTSPDDSIDSDDIINAPSDEAAPAPATELPDISGREGEPVDIINAPEKSLMPSLDTDAESEMIAPPPVEEIDEQPIETFPTLPESETTPEETAQPAAPDLDRLELEDAPTVNSNKDIPADLDLPDLDILDEKLNTSPPPSKEADDLDNDNRLGESSSTRPTLPEIVPLPEASAAPPQNGMFNRFSNFRNRLRQSLDPSTPELETAPEMPTPEESPQRDPNLTPQPPAAETSQPSDSRESNEFSAPPLTLETPTAESAESGIKTPVTRETESVTEPLEETSPSTDESNDRPDDGPNDNTQESPSLPLTL